MLFVIRYYLKVIFKGLTDIDITNRGTVLGSTRVDRY